MSSMPTAQFVSQRDQNFNTLSRDINFALDEGTVEDGNLTVGQWDFGGSGWQEKNITDIFRNPDTGNVFFLNEAIEGKLSTGQEDIFFKNEKSVGVTPSGQAIGGVEGQLINPLDVEAIFSPGSGTTERFRRAIQLSTLGEEQKRTGDFQTDFNKIVKKQEGVAQTKANKQASRKISSRIAAFSAGITGNVKTSARGVGEATTLGSPTLLGS